MKFHFEKKEMLHIADPKDIQDGKMADVCTKCFQDTMISFGEKQDRSNEGANRCRCGGRSKELPLPFIQDRKILWDLPKPQAIREYVLEQLPHFDL
jgi:hypothetical protein